ncbi:TPA: hypothetical protein DIC40_08595 [Patescibacteria group bacterium]|nr:hypothetical protein [Candidatus Gracilibacteria bacterium]
MYFAANNNYGQELRVSDGTANGTQMIKDIYSGANSSNPQILTVMDDKVYFRANNYYS